MMKIVRFAGMSLLGVVVGVLFEYFTGWGGVGAGVGVVVTGYEFWIVK
jgi:hypothetical protein